MLILKEILDNIKERKNVSFVSLKYALLCYPFAGYCWLSMRELTVHGYKLLKTKEESGEWRDLASSAQKNPQYKQK